jgi:acetyl esterase/lipase
MRDVPYLGKDRMEKMDLYLPAGRAEETRPAILIVHGGLSKAGISSQLLVIDGAPHSFHLQPKHRDLRPVVIKFFDQHLKRVETQK